MIRLGELYETYMRKCKYKRPTIRSHGVDVAVPWEQTCDYGQSNIAPLYTLYSTL